MESCRLADPTSYCAFRFGALFFANANSTTAIASTGAFFAQFALNSTSAPSDFSKFSWLSFVATMYAQGCSLLLEGAQRAASNKLRSTSGGTGLSLNARGLQRFLIRSFTGNSTGAGLLIIFLRDKKAALLRGLLNHFEINSDSNGVANDDSAAVQVCIPFHAKILPVHLGGCARRGARVAPGIFYGGRWAFHVEHRFLGHATNRQVTCDFQFACPVCFHFFRDKCHRRKVRHIKKLVALQILVPLFFARIHCFCVDRHVHFGLRYVLVVPDHRTGHVFEFATHRGDHHVLHGKLCRRMRRVNLPSGSCRRGLQRHGRGQNCYYPKLPRYLLHIPSPFFSKLRCFRTFFRFALSYFFHQLSKLLELCTAHMRKLLFVHRPHRGIELFEYFQSLWRYASLDHAAVVLLPFAR